MAYLNKAMLIGNVGKDAKIAVTPSGKKCASFSLATSRKYKDSQGQLKEQTEWHNIVCWGRLADAAEKLQIGKGTQMYVEGAITTRSWTDNNGQKRYTTEINAENFQLFGQRQLSSGNAQQPQQQQQGLQGNSYGSADDDDLPW